MAFIPITFIDSPPDPFPYREETPPEDVNQVIFLDIDGVLNSIRTMTAFGGSPLCGIRELWHRSDDVAVRLVRGLSRRAKAPIVLSSVWRNGEDDRLAAMSQFFGLNIIDRTGNEIGCRGNQIKAWLDRHPEINNYVILDDSSDMLEEQLAKFVQVDGVEGLSFKNITDACHILHITPYGINHKRNGVVNELPIGYRNKD